MMSLFNPIQIGSIFCPNRVVMAPMTRARASRDHVPTPMMAEYYAQRATAGLIISEAAAIGPMHRGWPFAPGIWTPAQSEGWKAVTSAVHAAGGRIVCQLWAGGRIVHPDLLGGEPPVSASATVAPGLARTYEGRKPFERARALERHEIAAIVSEFGTAATIAMEAGFDGVQIHSANGYLIDQFLRSTSNFRNDEYGGSIENRIRFLGEVTQAVVDSVGADRTSVRLSPNGEIQGVDDPDPIPLFGAAVKMLSRIGIASLELREPGFDSIWPAKYPPVWPHLRPLFDKVFILNSEFTRDKAEAALAEGEADAISFGRPFIANPDLPARLRTGGRLSDADADKYYEGAEKGYIDYPPLQASG